MLLKFRGSEGMIISVKVSQCLIGMSMNSSGNENAYDKYLLYMDKAISALQNNSENPETSELSQWFSRAAWNLALTPDIEPKYMFDFFLRCCCLCEISKNLTRLKNSLMLAAAAGLRVIRQMKGKTDVSERNVIISKVIAVVEKCKSLESGSNMALLRLLYLYEFEAECHAGKWKESTENMKEFLQLPFMDVKTLEHIAAIANEFTPYNYKIIMEALKIAAEKVSEKQHHNSSEASKTYHSLIQVMFNAQEYFYPSVEEESLQLCSKLLKLVENNTFQNYPQLEVLWIMIKCWNWGIYKLTHNDSKRAYKWCTLAMAFLNKLHSLKALHEKRLHEMYATYFSGFRNETDDY